MSHRKMAVATIYALRGERVCVWCINHRDAIREFNEYAKWLSGKSVDAAFMRSTLDVWFDVGGCVRFCSSNHLIDGITLTL